MLLSLELHGVARDEYPFNVTALRGLRRLEFAASRVTFFTGENGSGKSTLLEAIALNYGLSLEGGNRNFAFDAEVAQGDTYPLARAMTLHFRGPRMREGFFFRAETLFNLATKIDASDEELRGEPGRPISAGFGGKSLHARSHGEAFMTVLDYKFRRSGLFLLDEPEAALSPQRQLSFLILLHQTLRDYPDAQFIISTHSPILLGLPGAQIVSFDEDGIRPIAYEETPAFVITRRFLNAPEVMMERLLAEDEE